MKFGSNSSTFPSCSIAWSRLLVRTRYYLPAQPIHLRKNLPTVIEDAEQNLSPRLRWLLDRLWQEWKQTETDIKTITDEIERISNEDASCQRLRQIPGFGPLVSTATVAALGNGAAFRRGRDFAAWVGVVPRQYSTGGKQKLFGISKRGNIYLRRMLIHATRAVLLRVRYDTGGFGQWVHRLAQRAPRNKVVVKPTSHLTGRAMPRTRLFLPHTNSVRRPLGVSSYPTTRLAFL